ncbi:MAG TPA: aldehyde dehydrogenase family protein [Candidatus Acidoferrales bacterium]|nr:aldehyde dehydrogenase family protein [Candidatus Acidoferrales bacterium]
MGTTAPVQIQPGKLFIGGKWVEASSGETFPTINPATGEVLTHLVEAGEAEVDAAVKAARAAFEDGPWPKMDAADRGKLLFKIAELVEKHIDELARLETLDNGKPIFESRYVDMPMVVDVLQYYAGWASKIHGETIPVRGPYFNYTRREPIGVVGAIVPWNFPLLLASWKIAPALAAGNTVICKPAELTSLTALKFAELCQQAGLPDGVFNVLTGKGTGPGLGLVKHPGVDKIAFTGSTATGKAIMRAGAETLKRITLELGGKSPNIVFADADLDAAVKGAYSGIFYGKGEVCVAGSRLFVENKLHDAFMEKLLARAGKLQPGDPLDPKTRLGAVASEAQLKKDLEYVEIGKKEGARLLLGGERAWVGGSKGYFMQPTIFDGVRNDMRLAQEEIFGPVLATIEFGDVDEAIREANKNPYGLAAAVWTRDLRKAHYVAHRLQAGTVWVNTYGLFDAAAPFGGYKSSGFGRELGMHALEHYTQVKNIWINLQD